MKEIEKLNALATMTIRAYQKKNQRLKMIICGLVILYVITIVCFFSYLNICTEKKEAAFAGCSPLCISILCRTIAKHERTVVV